MPFLFVHLVKSRGRSRWPRGAGGLLLALRPSPSPFYGRCTMDAFRLESLEATVSAQGANLRLEPPGERSALFYTLESAPQAKLLSSEEFEILQEPGEHWRKRFALSSHRGSNGNTSVAKSTKKM